MSILGIVVIVIIGIGFGFGGSALLDGRLSINWFLLIGAAFVVGVLFLLGGIFGRNHNTDRDINGEIEGRLQHFANKRVKLLGQIGHPENNGDWSPYQKQIFDRVDQLKEQEAEFRETIEYGTVTDGSENYYSYKKGLR